MGYIFIYSLCGFILAFIAGMGAQSLGGSEQVSVNVAFGISFAGLVYSLWVANSWSTNVKGLYGDGFALGPHIPFLIGVVWYLFKYTILGTLLAYMAMAALYVLGLINDVSVFLGGLGLVGGFVWGLSKSGGWVSTVKNMPLNKHYSPSGSAFRVTGMTGMGVDDSIHGGVDQDT